MAQGFVTPQNLQFPLPTNLGGTGRVSPNLVLSSSSSGNFSGVASSLTLVTNMTLSITTLGGPVKLGINHDGTNNIGRLQCSANTGNLVLAFFRGGSQLNLEYASQGEPEPLGSFNFIDTGVSGSAGTYTYTLEYYVTGGLTAYVSYGKLYALELV